MSITPQLRPLGIGDLSDAAFRLYRERFWTLIAISTLVFVPTVILRSILLVPFFSGSFIPIGFFGFYATSLLVNMFWSLIFESLLNGALVAAISHAYLGCPISVVGAYRAGMRRYGTLVAASIVP